MAFCVKLFVSFPWRTVALHWGHFHAMPRTWLLAMYVYLNALHIRSLLCPALEPTTIWVINVFIRKYVQCFRQQTCMLTSTPGFIPKLRALPINYIIRGRHKRRGTKERLPSAVVQDAHLPCQLAWICSLLGDTPLKRYLKEFPERFNSEGKAHPACTAPFHELIRRKRKESTLNTSVIP